MYGLTSSRVKAACRGSAAAKACAYEISRPGWLSKLLLEWMRRQVSQRHIPPAPGAIHTPGAGRLPRAAGRGS